MYGYINIHIIYNQVLAELSYQNVFVGIQCYFAFIRQTKSNPLHMQLALGTKTNTSVQTLNDWRNTVVCTAAKRYALEMLQLGWTLDKIMMMKCKRHRRAYGRWRIAWPNYHLLCLGRTFSCDAIRFTIHTLEVAPTLPCIRVIAHHVG